MSRIREYKWNQGFFSGGLSVPQKLMYSDLFTVYNQFKKATSKAVSQCTFCLVLMIIFHLSNELIHFSQKSPYLSMPACPYLSISWYKTTNCTFQISIELLLKLLIQKSLSLIFSQQYSQVLLNEDENLKCLKFVTKQKMKHSYLYRCYYICLSLNPLSLNHNLSYIYS